MAGYTTPHATIQQALQRHDYSLPEGNAHVQQVMHRLKTCRTAAMGYHAYRCSDETCGYIKYQYHSCRDRHCPNCGALKKQEWIEARMQELLPVKYYHVVFTLPHELNSLVLGHRKLLFKLLFDASAQTLLTFAKDARYLGALPGIISVLHTWGQQLSFHPHIHCIVSGGGIINDNEWKDAKKSHYRFLFPVKAMQAVFRGKFLQSLKGMIASGEVTLPEGVDAKQLLNVLYRKDWIVYAKAPFGGPHSVIEYLGRYTHKVAISNHRICSIDNDTVTFDYKDYADGNAKKQMSLTTVEFIRRFEQHVLPKRFTKIRTYGYLGNRKRHQRINAVLKNMRLPLHKGLVKVPLELKMKEQYGIDLKECPCCKGQTLQLVQVYYPWKHTDDG
ncbi:IS91 family transposase [Segetibacter koreensis]|uniref:IS91 family transposase n=1 Tax=Segetibacter koreensis TaxID=398037 RepID=UPI00038261D4|nr:IS91 family transposase [Segetibacter koreensis]